MVEWLRKGHYIAHFKHVEYQQTNPNKIINITFPQLYTFIPKILEIKPNIPCSWQYWFQSSLLSQKKKETAADTNNTFSQTVHSNMTY